MGRLLVDLSGRNLKEMRIFEVKQILFVILVHLYTSSSTRNIFHGFTKKCTYATYNYFSTLCMPDVTLLIPHACITSIVRYCILYHCSYDNIENLNVLKKY